MKKAAYHELLSSDSFPERIARARDHLSSCTVCPEVCRVDRTADEVGNCGIGNLAWVSSYGPHLGEEAPLRGWKGSGTIFFSGCNLSCKYCQNASISQKKSGQEMDARQLAEVMLQLQGRGCHNINFVSPSHVVPQILEAVYLAAKEGLEIPLVYNTGGYDSLAMLKLLSGVIDIYMPDMKYSQDEVGEKYSRVRHYPTVNRRGVKEMHRQVGDLVINQEGIAQRGLLVRHLVLPHDLAGSSSVLRFLAEEISPDTYINIMDQYRPSYQVYDDSHLGRMVTREEYSRVRVLAEELGLQRGDRH